MSDVREEDEATARANERVGQVLQGKYRLDRVIGIGGMAAVYAATHRNQKRLAVKMLHMELSFVPTIRARFLREGYVANTVGHPGALAVLDEDVSEDGAAFLVMELLDGRPLDSLAEAYGGVLSESVALAVGDQLTDVLAAAHAKAIVHRDIKPANLFVTRDGTLKVLDFGIARLRDAATAEATRTGVLLGTPAFMAPEQAYGRNSEIDGQSDVWAAGATLFHLLAGQDVHAGGTLSDILIKAATSPAPSLATLRPDAHPRVIALVDRALAFEKASRWSTAAAMRDEIRAIVRESFRGGLSGKPALAELLEGVGGVSSPSVPEPSDATEVSGPMSIAPRMAAWQEQPDAEPPPPVSAVRLPPFAATLEVPVAAPAVAAPPVAAPLVAAPPVASQVTTEAPSTGNARPGPPGSSLRQALVGVALAVALAGAVVALILARGWLTGRSSSRSPASTAPSAPTSQAGDF